MKKIILTKGKNLLKITVFLLIINSFVIRASQAIIEFEEEFIPYYQGICREHDLRMEKESTRRESRTLGEQKLFLLKIRDIAAPFVRGKMKEAASFIQQCTQQLFQPFFLIGGHMQNFSLRSYPTSVPHRVSLSQQVYQSSASSLNSGNGGGSSGSPRKLADDSLQDIQRMELGIKDVEERLGNQKVGDKATILLGNTGSGKTTVFNYLNGVPLVAKMVKGKLKVDKRETTDAEDEKGKIVHGFRSGTTFPHMSKGYFDCPGFQDNRGAVQDLVNAYSVYKLFEQTQRVRLVLVVSKENLEAERGNSFATLLRQIEEMFPGKVEEVKKSLNVVVTKYSKGDLRSFKEDMQKLEDDRGNGLSDFQREILGFLAKTDNDRITFFDKPGVVGEIPRGIELVKKGSYVDIDRLKPTPHISVSDSTKIHIKDLADQLTQQTSGFLQSFRTDLKTYTRALIKSQDGPASELRASFKSIVDDLKSVKGSSQTFETDAKHVGNALEKLKPELASEFSALVARRRFLMRIKPQDLSINLDLNVNGQLTAARTDLAPLSHEPILEMDRGFLKLKGHIIGTSDLSPERLPGVTRLTGYGLNSLLVDRDVTLPGANVVFVSPYWKVAGNKYINLQGREGAEITRLQARNAANGEPGNPGQSGGNFYGSAGEVQNVAGLTLNVSGGNGGSGQKGGDGINGVNGKDGVKEDIEQRKSSACTLNEDPVSRGSFVGWLRWAFVPNKESRQTYRCGIPGKAGGNAGAGGKGGYGGHVGSVALDNLVASNPSYKISVISNEGQRGANGLPGRPGKGGINGRVWEGIYINKSFGWGGYLKKGTGNAASGALIGGAIGSFGGPIGIACGAKIGAAAGGGVGVVAPLVGHAADCALDEGWKDAPHMLPFVEHAPDGTVPQGVNADDIKRPEEAVPIDEVQARRNWENERKSSS